MKNGLKERLIMIGMRVVGCILLLAFTAWFVFAMTSREAEDEIIFIAPTANDTCIYDSIKGEWIYVSDSVMNLRKAKEKREKEELMRIYQRRYEQIEKKNIEKSRNKN